MARGSVAAELSSMSTAVEELTKRITAIAETCSATKRHDLAGELFKAERALQGAQRTLDRVIAWDS